MVDHSIPSEIDDSGGPEHTDVRLPLIDQLLSLGWTDDQLQWDPEWRVPKTPSEHSRREAGQKYEGYPVDLMIWESGARREDPEAALVIVETKKPTSQEGRTQLENYLSLEYTAKMGYWTNGDDSLAIYRLPTGRFTYVPGAAVPRPSDTFSIVSDMPMRFDDLDEPDPEYLRWKLGRIFGVVVGRDTVSTRSDQRLNHLCNLLLTKLASDQSAKRAKRDAIVFQPMKTEEETATRIRSAFKRLKSSYPLIFESSDDDAIRFDNHTIHDVVYELASIKLVDVTPETISEAFQVFRAANLKSGEGQYFTPSRVIRSAVALMEVGYDDRIIDPACGTGGFLVESYLALARENPDLSETDLQHWAQTHVYGVDRDDINVKLARAIMQIIGDGSSNIEIGDSLRQHMWKQDYPHLKKTLADESYTCVITNPPFGRALRMSAKDARLSRYTITRKSTDRHHDLEVGLVFLERCYRLLSDRGRLGIILPETYWFSGTYTWLREWLESRFVLRGMFNVPMEAFQSFCRAKTNFYVLEKIADKAKSDNTAEIAPPRPSWFRENKVVVSSAPTCGINKDGIERVLVDPEQEAEGDILYADVKAIRRRRSTATTRIVPIDRVIEPWRAVPTHFDTGPLRAFESARQNLWPGWSEVAIDELIGRKWMIRRDGHGSPPKDQRSGVIPYIKVSDLRAGLVNINPTNMVSQELAEQLWNSESSGLQSFDLLSPERASSNIGEFCVLMPGQEQVVITREVLIFRVTSSAPFDAFFLLWALSLRVVREQWRRVTFMQTNREDVGDRYREILLPIPIGEDGAFDEEQARVASRDFREYFVGLSKLRTQFARSLSAFDVYHFKLSVPSETDSVSQV